MNCIIVHESYFTLKVWKNAVWTFCWASFFMFLRRNKIIQVWRWVNDMMFMFECTIFKLFLVIAPFFFTSWQPLNFFFLFSRIPKINARKSIWEILAPFREKCLLFARERRDAIKRVQAVIKHQMEGPSICSSSAGTWELSLVQLRFWQCITCSLPRTKASRLARERE